MDKDAPSLSREKAIELLTSQQVVNAEFFNSLRQTTPLLSKLMMDKFKIFLDDTYFTDLERQTMLMKFFEEQSDIDVLQDVLEYVQKCECKDDYTQVIMEWTFHNSTDLVKKHLAKFDGAKLYEDKQKDKLIKPPDITDSFIENIIQLTMDIDDEQL